MAFLSNPHIEDITHDHRPKLQLYQYYFGI